MIENIFELPIMATVKYYNFLQVEPSYDITEIRQSNISFCPFIYEKRMLVLTRVTDFLISNEENDSAVVIDEEVFRDMIAKAEKIRMFAEVSKKIKWDLQEKKI